MVIQRRLGVGHAADSGEASSGSSPASGGDGFLVLKTGLSQVAVEVNKSGADYQPLGGQGIIIRLGWGCLPLAQPGNLALDDKQAANIIYPLAGVNYMPPLNN
jgi:hypothetical protein